MLIVILAAIDAFSDEHFKLLYLFVLFMDWHILENVDWKSVFKRNKGGINMKTLTKHSLNRLATLSESGCFSEDDKSHRGVIETSENGLGTIRYENSPPFGGL